MTAGQVHHRLQLGKQEVRTDGGRCKVEPGMQIMQVRLQSLSRP